MLGSLTPDLRFTATFSAEWWSGQDEHRNVESVVARDLLERAVKLSERWSVDEVRPAQDQLNAELGREYDSAHGYYRGLVATVQLFVDDDTAEVARQWRRDRARVQRMRYLKSILYSDPELLLLDHLERYPEDLGTVDVKPFQQLARTVRTGNASWYPLLDALARLSSASNPVCGDVTAMKAILKAVKEAAPELIELHGLRDETA
ncbi:hypothetical protein ACFU7Y_25765 [Kitasatospora sp. NPDC057542]|uniref:hypothetical protein n=1 Tax=Streptomycetaceae TaxID=2062 RepID=UPI001CCCF8ED|nr:hypothetical protein [Streptomyces sp. LS1784]